MGGFTRETSDRAAEAALEFIESAYANYKREREFGSTRKEPAITLGLIANYLAQHNIAHEAPYLPDSKFFNRWTYQLASAALAKLKRQGRVITSWGPGLQGKEVRCYEPSYTSKPSFGKRSRKYSP